MAELREGEAIEIEGNKGRRYILAKWRGLYSCTCPSWQRCPHPVDERSCKHLDRFLQDDENEAYIVEARKSVELRAAGKPIPLEMARRGRPSTSNHPQVIEDPAAIERAIDRLALSRRLWLDTEVADWRIGAGRISLIQAMPAECDPIPANVVVLDMLHYPELIRVFERKIMAVSTIEKVFHNASYDLQFLSTFGVESVHCTKVIATRLRGRHHSLPQHASLKKLAEHFQLTSDVDKTEQKSDWSKRPLSKQQIEYAIYDIVYLRGIDMGLQQLMGSSGEPLVKRRHASPRKSLGRRREMMKIESRKIEPQEPTNSVQLPENSTELPMKVLLTWYSLSKGEATVAELAKKNGGEPTVYKYLAAAMRHGKKVDIRMLVNRTNERTLTQIWQQLSAKNRTPNGLREASGLSLPIEAFKCVVELFKNGVLSVAGGKPEPVAPTSQSSTQAPVQPTRSGRIGPLRRRAKRKAKVAIQLTDEQLMVLDLFKSQRSLKIHAFAGAGKTQTLVEVGKSTTRKGLYLSFSRKNAAEASKRCPSSVDCMTTHGLAFRMMRNSFSNEKLTKAITVSAVRNALSLRELILQRRWTSYEIAILTLGMLRDWLLSSEESFDKAFLPDAMVLNACTDADKYEIQNHCRRLADRCWQLMKSNSDAIPLSHDGYLKLWALTQPEIKADYIMLDEAQDSNAIILEVLARQSCQKIMVGDRHQQIYEWRGAVDAMTRLHADEEQFLTQTFRFGDDIGVYANAVLQRLNEPKTLRVFGAASPLAATTACRAFLARTNATVIKELMARHGDGWKVHIQGGTKEMERLVRGIGDIQQGRPSSVAELIGFASWEELVNTVQLDKRCELHVIVSLVERLGVDELLSCLQGTVGEDDNPEIVLSTVHKAKGLEWDCVELSADLMKNLPENHWSTTRLEQSELRLLYVAVTRARKELTLPREIRRFLSVTG